MKTAMNELKKNLEKYLESECDTGMLLLIGKDEAELMLNVFKALDKACEELNDFTEFVPMSNLPFEDETYTKFINSFDEEECINIWKYWLLNGCEEAINTLSERYTKEN